ncbi:MAG TPA: penicillin-binding protein activator [Alphaproteobacteria bacterium]
MLTYSSTLRSIVMLALLALLSGCAGGPASPTGPGSEPRAVNVPHVPDFDPLAQNTQVSPLQTNPDKVDAGKTETPPLKVGLLLPLSGPQAPLGQAMLNASQLALSDLNIENVSLIPRDTAVDAPKAAREALNEGATIFLGPVFAANVRDVAPIAAEANAPILSFSTDWTIANNNTAVLGFLPFSQVTRIVDFAIKQGSKRFAILIPETPYGMAVAGAVRNSLQQQNLPASIEVRFNDKNLNEAMRTLSQQSYDTLILPVGGKALQTVATLLRQNDVPLSSLRVLGTGLWDEDPIARSGIIEGAYYAAPDPGQRARFITRYSKMFGAKPPRLATLAYDATALVSVLSINGKDPTNSENLHNQAGFMGIDGMFRIRPDNLNERGLAVLQIRGNQAAVADPAPTRF